MADPGDARQQAADDSALIRKQLERLVLLERQAGRRDIKAHDAIAAHNRLERRVQEAERALRRAADVAEHLFQMIDPQTWRDTGGDDGQGHYEGDYRAEQTLAEIRSWINA